MRDRCLYFSPNPAWGCMTRRRHLMCLSPAVPVSPLSLVKTWWFLLGDPCGFGEADSPPVSERQAPASGWRLLQEWESHRTQCRVCQGHELSLRLRGHRGLPCLGRLQAVAVRPAVPTASFSRKRVWGRNRSGRPSSEILEEKQLGSWWCWKSLNQTVPEILPTLRVLRIQS